MKLIGIDIGGTHTRIRVGAVDRDDHSDARLDTVDWTAQRGLSDPDAAAVLLGHAYRLGADRGSALAVGAHGCDSESLIAGFRSALRVHHDGPLVVLNDASLLAPAAGVESAVGVIAGTGSIVVGISAEGRIITVGGHGWMIGDPGSAPSLVRESVKSTLHDHDLGLEPDELARHLLQHYGVGTVEGLAETFLHRASIHHWASAAPAVFAAAEAGAESAHRIIELAAEELAVGVRTALERGARAEAVVTAGGVIVHQPLLQRRLREALEREQVTTPLIVLLGDPVGGALELARRAAAGAASAASEPIASDRTALPHYEQGGTP